MRVDRWIAGAAAALGMIVLANGFAGRGGAAPNTVPATLPGAMPVIDAAKYPGIQAAIDALPPTGGAVRLPPGTFEIREPLRISVSDVLFEGAGSATHIRNLNAEGKSAIILRHPSGDESRKGELWRIRLANFRLTGNERSGHGIEARRVNELGSSQVVEM